MNKEFSKEVLKENLDKFFEQMKQFIDEDRTDLFWQYALSLAVSSTMGLYHAGGITIEAAVDIFKKSLEEVADITEAILFGGDDGIVH